MFSVTLSPEARVFYEKADPPLARKLSRCFAQLERNPHRYGNIKRLTGELRGYLRYRVGDWRVVYRVDESAQSVWVVVIAHRREVYE
jgi:mRNA interferase RelE/StbE